MFIHRLDLSSAAELETATEVLMHSPGYLLSSYGLLPSREACRDLALSFPADCKPEDRLGFTACIKDVPVAFAQVARHWPSRRQASILLLSVSETAQRRHLGCEFVERLSKKARQWEGVDNWYITVLENNERAHRFWAHCGFYSVAVDVDAPGHPCKVVNMRRAIKQRPVCQSGKLRDNPTQVLANRLATRIVA